MVVGYDISKRGHHKPPRNPQTERGYFALQKAVHRLQVRIERYTIGVCRIAAALRAIFAGAQILAKGFAEKIADLLEHREAQQKKEREEAKRNPHRASARRQDDQDLER